MITKEGSATSKLKLNIWSRFCKQIVFYSNKLFSHRYLFCCSFFWLNWGHSCFAASNKCLRSSSLHSRNTCNIIAFYRAASLLPDTPFLNNFSHVLCLQLYVGATVAIWSSICGYNKLWPFFFVCLFCTPKLPWLNFSAGSVGWQIC